MPTIEIDVILVVNHAHVWLHNIIMDKQDRDISKLLLSFCREEKPTKTTSFVFRYSRPTVREQQK